MFDSVLIFTATVLVLSCSLKVLNSVKLAGVTALIYESRYHCLDLGCKKNEEPRWRIDISDISRHVSLREHLQTSKKTI